VRFDWGAARVRVDSLSKGTLFRSYGDGKAYEYDHDHRGACVVEDVTTGDTNWFAGCATALPVGFTPKLCRCDLAPDHVRVVNGHSFRCEPCGVTTNNLPTFGAAAKEWDEWWGGKDDDKSLCWRCGRRRVDGAACSECNW
jgi:hypothetical protein